jgi:hypothetical protein
VQITNIITAPFQHYTVAKNFPGYKYAICKNIGKLAPQTGMKFSRSFRRAQRPWASNKGAGPPPFYIPVLNEQNN